MKTHEEFRRAVFEKAELYEKKRKARAKKIIETASLCSLSVVIGISAYFGFYNFSRDLKAEADGIATSPVAEASPTIEDGNTTGAPLDTTDEMTFATTTFATTEMTHAMTTVVEATYVSTTTVATTMTTEATYTEATENVILETTEATVDYSTPVDTFSFATTATPIQPTYGYYCHDGFICDKQCGNEATLYVCESLPALDNALQGALGECLSVEDQSYFEETFNQSFFEDSVLVVIHVPDAYVWKVELENGIFTISKDRSNASASGYDVLIAYTISKETFSHATLIAPCD